MEACGICGSYQKLTTDHIIPRSKGGTDDPTNLRILCLSCNSIRRDGDWTDSDVLRRRVSNYYQDYRGAAVNAALPYLPRPIELSNHSFEALQRLPIFGGQYGT
ncbi:MAG: HNH endonuclease [Candidatus Lutacidiplasmatales archaeon]